MEIAKNIQQKETIRLETFSDGVFCIAITLLTLEIGVEAKQNISNKELAHELISKWPLCAAYIISFVNVLLAWIGHHSLFQYISRTSNFVMIANGFLLMLVALVPFPTKTLGQYFGTEAFQTAVIFYSAYFVFISLAFRLLWHAASKDRTLLISSISEKEINTFTKNENIGLICNSIILATAFVNPWVALALSFAMWVYWILFA
jgi:uncharacterized membrane protein